MGKSYFLTTENIDVISEEVFKFLQEQKLVKEDVIRARLSVETALLQWLEHGNEGREVTVECTKRFHRPVIRLVMEGPMCNPVHFSEQDDALEYVTTLQGNLGLSVVYEYDRGRNLYDVKLPLPAMGSTLKMALAIVASLLTWQLMQFAPANVTAGICANVIDPTFNMLVGLIAAVTTLLIFFNVCSAICGMGNLNTLSELGGGVMKRAQLHNVVWLIVGTVVAALTFGVVDYSGGLTLSMLGDIYKMALGVVPGSVLEPFVSGNTLQVLFLAACSGILVLILGQQIRHLTDVIREVNIFLMTAISYFCYVVPVIIYLSFTGILLSGEFDSFMNSWKTMAVAYGVGLFAIFGETLWCALESKFDIKQHFARVLQVTVLAFTTASTAACIPLMTKLLKDDGVDDGYRDFALPFSQTVVKTGEVIGFSIAVLGMLSVYNQTISVSGLIVNMLSYLLLAQTLAPVAGAGISVMTLLLLQAGLPKEAVATYIAMSLFVDMVATCLNKTSVMNAVFTCAKKDGKIKE